MDVQASTPAGSLLEQKGKGHIRPADIRSPFAASSTAWKRILDYRGMCSSEEKHYKTCFSRILRSLASSVARKKRSPTALGTIYSSLSLGASRAGALFHAHAPAWNALIFGKKRWLLFDERLISKEHQPLITALKKMGKPTSSNFSNADFLTTEYRTPQFQEWWRSHGYECVQEPGEMLYIPDRFYHAILNLGEAVAVIGELCAEGPGCNSAGKAQICQESAHCAMCHPSCQQHFGCVVGSSQKRRSPLCDTYRT